MFHDDIQEGYDAIMYTSDGDRGHACMLQVMVIGDMHACTQVMVIRDMHVTSDGDQGHACYK